MLFFDVQHEFLSSKEPVEAKCPCCQCSSAIKTSEVNYLSFSTIPLLPVGVTTKYRCNRCTRLYSPSQSAKSLKLKLAQLQLNFWQLAKKSIGLPVLICLLWFASNYQSLQQQWQQEARQAPKLNDIVFIDYSMKSDTKKDRYYPVRMARVVDIDNKNNTLSVELSSFAYDNIETANRDYVVRNYLFSNYFNRKSLKISQQEMFDTSLILNVRRPFEEQIVSFVSTDSVMQKYRDISQFVNDNMFNVTSNSNGYKSVGMIAVSMLFRQLDD